MRIGQAAACTVVSLMIIGSITGCGDSDLPSAPSRLTLLAPDCGALAQFLNLSGLGK